LSREECGTAIAAGVLPLGPGVAGSGATLIHDATRYGPDTPRSGQLAGSMTQRRGVGRDCCRDKLPSATALPEQYNLSWLAGADAVVCGDGWAANTTEKLRRPPLQRGGRGSGLPFDSDKSPLLSECEPQWRLPPLAPVRRLSVKIIKTTPSRQGRPVPTALPALHRSTARACGR